MTNNFEFRIIDEREKKVELICKNKTLRLKLKKKRSFTVLKRLLASYPNYLNIHDLDGELNDPNRAHSDLRVEDGFANFLEEKRGDKRVMHLRLNIGKLFKYVRGSNNPNTFICIANAKESRGNIPTDIKKRVYEKSFGRCNITGLKVCDIVNESKFCKSLMVSAYDHRRPISKNGSDIENNLQLLCDLINSEKNKICNACEGTNCEQCALAYPELFYIIRPTGQDIQELRVHQIPLQTDTQHGKGLEITLSEFEKGKREG